MNSHNSENEDIFFASNSGISTVLPKFASPSNFTGVTERDDVAKVFYVLGS